MAAAAVLVAATAVVWLLVPRALSAEEQALAYFSALADGDVEAVHDHGISVDPEAEEAFLHASEYLSAATVRSSVAGASSTTVTVSYRFGAESFESEIVMIQRSGQWVPDTASAVGTVTSDTAVTIGDAVLSADAEHTLLPAVYEASAAPAEFLAGSASIVVPSGGTQNLEINATLRPEATALAQHQLNEYAKTCTQPGAAPAESCGIVIPWAAEFTSVSKISYRIEQMPTISLTLDAFHADGGVLAATVTGTGLDGSEQSLSYRTTSWSLRGDVAFRGDEIVLSAW